MGPEDRDVLEVLHTSVLDSARALNDATDPAARRILKRVALVSLRTFVRFVEMPNPQPYKVGFTAQ